MKDINLILNCSTYSEIFFTELYIDQHQKIYQDLGFQRFSFFSLPRLLLSKVSRDAITKVMITIDCKSNELIIGCWLHDRVKKEVLEEI